MSAWSVKIEMQLTIKQKKVDDDVELVDFGQGRFVKKTKSLCPVCLLRIEAQVYERSHRIWMDKECQNHGKFSALLSSDVTHYYRFDRRLEGLSSCCGPGQHCGDQTANHSCTMLIEITQRCNLSCPTCFADSSPERNEFLSLEEFEILIDGLLANGKGDADVLQLSGGEPTIHPQLFEIMDACLERGFRRVYINTNGIKLANRSFAQRLAAYQDKVSVYLQFDGIEPETSRLLRGRGNLIEQKLSALAYCNEFNLDTVPVMTLTAGVNDHELGAIIKLAKDSACIRKIMIQPAMYSGRYQLPRLVERLGVADVVEAIVEQTGGVFNADDFGPIPCSDPNCFSLAVALRTSTGLLPISRYFPRYQNWGDDEQHPLIDQLSDSFDDPKEIKAAIEWAMTSGVLDSLEEDKVDQLLDSMAESQLHAGDDGWGGILAIGIKPFMDAYTYDQDRIDRCCVHIISRNGQPVSFCEYNAINRAQGAL